MNKSKAWPGPLMTRMNVPVWRKFVSEVLLPEFLGQPWRYEHARVVRRLSTSEAAEKGALYWGYYLEVAFHEHEDCQTLYPRWWKKRRGIVRVSRKLYEAQPHTVHIFYQYSRVWNNETSVRIRLAR